MPERMPACRKLCRRKGGSNELTLTSGHPYGLYSGPTGHPKPSRKVAPLFVCSPFPPPNPVARAAVERCPIGGRQRGGESPCNRY